MKPIRQIMTFGTVLAWSIAICFGMAGTACAQASGMQYCEVTLTGCPEEYDGKELVVPLDVIAVSTHIRACGIVDSITGSGGDGSGKPAVMFVIDNSGSMTGDNGHDRNGNRFRVTRALIDSIYSVYEDAEVGIVLFGDVLQFNATGDTRLERFNGPTTSASNQSFMPLRPLNGSVTANGYYNAGQAGDAEATYRGLLRSLFNIPANINNAASIRTGGNNGISLINGNYTDISLAFEAAVQAFQSTSVPKENQYIIFLSDGEPNVRSSNGAMRLARRFDYVLGEVRDSLGSSRNSIPTTYTVFLNNVGTRDALPITLDTVLSIPRNAAGLPDNFYSVLDSIAGISAPATVSGMTYNIRQNAYSSSNTKSDIWILQSNYDSLLALMMENIITPMLSTAEGNAKTIVISSSTGASDSTGAVDGGFTFNKRLPVDTSVVTTVSMGIRYEVKIDSTYFDPVAGADTTVTRIVPDSLFTYEFTIRRTADPGNDWRQNQNLVDFCGAKPTLSLMFQGDTLASSSNNSVSEAKGHMDRLTVVFDNTGGLFDYGSGVAVQVMNADGTFTDLENFTLTGASDGSNVYSFDFERVVASTENLGDGRLQHTAKDSIIIVFRNPDMPLDTIRLAVSFKSMDVEFYSQGGSPVSANKLSDTIRVVAGVQQNIYALFFDPEGSWLQEYESDPALISNITWTISDPANVSLSPVQGNFTTFNSTSANNAYTVTATYRYGALTLSRSIHVIVDPIWMALYSQSGNPGGKLPLLDTTITAGHDMLIYAKLFDPDSNWLSGYEDDEALRANITWTVSDANARLTPAQGNFTKFECTVAYRTYVVRATLTLPGLTVSSLAYITVDPAQAVSLEIVNDSVNIDRNNRSGFNEITFERETAAVKVWAVRRDAFGNLVEFAENAVWESCEYVDVKGSGSSAVIERKRGAGEGVVTVSDGTLTPDSINVIVIGESSVAAGPNPFIPGKSNLQEHLGPRAYDYYREIILSSNNASGSGSSSGTGVLIAVESPRPLRNATAKVMIYDAVGNVVLSTTTKGKLTGSNTYGFVWDGKNSRGRTVGPGTYLLRISGVQDNGQKFQVQKKMGVTK
ncbi:MAG: hypothetical protein LBI42_07970 [Chitinispirillales bacterium]|jgi:hypothetical protein|nr:hypothetical protein [Chitinispirillales bacterium]